MLWLSEICFKMVWHFDVTLRLNLNKGRDKIKRVEDVFSNILFLKSHSSSQDYCLMIISNLNTLILQSFDARFLKTLTT